MDIPISHPSAKILVNLIRSNHHNRSYILRYPYTPLSIWPHVQRLRTILRHSLRQNCSDHFPFKRSQSVEAACFPIPPSPRRRQPMDPARVYRNLHRPIVEWPQLIIWQRGLAGDRRRRAARSARVCFEPRRAIRRGARSPKLGHTCCANEGGGEGQKGGSFDSWPGCGERDHCCA